MNASNKDRLTKNFTLGEFTRSTTAEIHNITVEVEQDSVVHMNLKRLCVVVLQPLRNALGPVQITSGYRPPELNHLISGSATSQHMYGLAGDIQVKGYSPQEVAEWIRDNIEDYDQLIHEFGGWVHVSVAPEDRDPRRSCLTAVKGDNGTEYVTGIHSVKDATRKVA